MEYKIVEVAAKKLVKQTFEFPVAEVETVDYSGFYEQTCKGLNGNFDESYGIYDFTPTTCKFHVAIDYPENEKGYEEIMLKSGEYYEFEIDLAKNAEKNQYQACFDQLQADNQPFNMGYSFELMDKSFCPETNSFKFKYYIAKQ